MHHIQPCIIRTRNGSIKQYSQTTKTAAHEYLIDRLLDNGRHPYSKWDQIVFPLACLVDWYDKTDAPLQIEASLLVWITDRIEMWMIWDENAKVRAMITQKQGGAITISPHQQSSHSSFLALPKPPFNYLTTAKLIHLFFP